MRVTVRAYPSAKRTSVGGRYGSGEPPVLIVRVTAPAVDGKANEAVRRAVANALGLPPRSVLIVSGDASRTKVLELEGADPRAVEALVERGER